MADLRERTYEGICSRVSRCLMPSKCLSSGIIDHLRSHRFCHLMSWRFTMILTAAVPIFSCDTAELGESSGGKPVAMPASPGTPAMPVSPGTPATPTTPGSARKENVWRNVFHPGSNLATKTIGGHYFDKPQPNSPTVYDWYADPSCLQISIFTCLSAALASELTMIRRCYDRLYSDETRSKHRWAVDRFKISSKSVVNSACFAFSFLPSWGVLLLFVWVLISESYVLPRERILSVGISTKKKKNHPVRRHERAGIYLQ